jgi:hypothetical protein
MSYLSRLPSAAAGVSLWILGMAVAADEPPPEAPAAESREYVRVVRGEDQKPVALQTAIVRFAKPRSGAKSGDTANPGDAATIDLIGAIHVADKSYFDELNRRFRDYDAVLYELVAPEEANVPQPGRGSGSFVGGMQVGMTQLLDLEFQLDWINYRRQNMVHADMSPTEFSAKMKERNESFTGMFFRMMGRAMAEQAERPTATNDWQMLAAMFAPDRPHRLKLIMAEQFADVESQIGMIEGPDGSTIISERNKKALAVLRRELAAGKQRVAIFYGAGHLPDLCTRLEKEFGYQPVKTTWLNAWSLAPKPAPEVSKQERGNG